MILPPAISLISIFWISDMDRLRDFDSQLMSNNEKESIILLVVFGSQNPGLWTAENFNDEELLRMWKQAIQKYNGKSP